MFDDAPPREFGFGSTIFPFRVSEKTAVRNLPKSSSFVMPFAAIFAERVRFGMTTPSNTSSSVLPRFIRAIAIPLLPHDVEQLFTIGDQDIRKQILVAPPGLEPGLSALKELSKVISLLSTLQCDATNLQ